MHQCTREYSFGDGRPASHPLSVFLLPGLGATLESVSSSDYELSALLHELSLFGRVTILLHVPDIDRRTRDCVDLEGVVSSLARTIKQRCGANPPVLVGYSIGGFIAFAICHRLQAEGLRVRLLLMLDSSAVFFPAPQRRSTSQVGLPGVSGVAAGVAKAPFVLAVRWGQLEIARVWLLVLRRVLGAKKVNPLRLKLLLIYWGIAHKNFQLPRYDGDVVLIKAKKGRPRIKDPDLGWRPYARKIKITVAEGDHWTMMRREELLLRVREALTSLDVESYAEAALVQERS